MISTRITKVKVYIKGIEWRYVCDTTWWAAVRYHNDSSGKITHTNWYDSAEQLLWALVNDY